MVDPLSVAAAAFQLWALVVVFFIVLPAMFGVSLGVSGVYIQILVRILQVRPPGQDLPLQWQCEVRGHMTVSVVAVGDRTDPEGTARAARRRHPVHR